MNKWDESVYITVDDLEIRLTALFAVGVPMFLGSIALMTPRRFFQERTLRAFQVSQLLFLAWLVIASASIVTNFEKAQFLTLVIYALPTTLIFILPKFTFWNLSHVRKLVSWFLMFAAANALVFVVFALFSALYLNVLGWGSIPMGTELLTRARLPLGHPITVGGVLLMSVPLFLQRIEEYRVQNKKRAYYISALVLTCLAILLSLSRMIILVLVVYILYLLVRRFGMKSLRKGSWLVVVLGIGAIVSFIFVSIERLNLETSTEWRLESLKVASEAFTDSPILGVGIGALYPRLEMEPQGEVEFLSGTPVVYYKRYATLVDPHNLYALVFTESGVLGGIAFLTFIVSVAMLLKGRISNPFRHAFIISLLQFLANSDLLIHVRFSIIFWSVVALGVVAKRLEYADDSGNVVSSEQ